MIKQKALEKEAKNEKDRYEKAIERMKNKNHWCYNVNTDKYMLDCGSFFQEIDECDIKILLKEQMNKDVVWCKKETIEYCECHTKCYCNNILVVCFKE